MGCIAIAISISASAQAGRAYTMPTIAGDTLTASSSVDTVAKTFTVTGGYSSMGIQVDAKVISGSVSNGKAYLFRSFDGYNYKVVDSASYTAVPSWALTTATATHVAQFDVSNPPVGTNYYVVCTTGAAATTSTAIKVKYTLRRYQAQ